MEAIGSVDAPGSSRIVTAATTIWTCTAFQSHATAPAALVATAPAATDPLGDLSAMKKIISDVETIANTGDMAAAEKRITDFETAPVGSNRTSDAWGAMGICWTVMHYGDMQLNGGGIHCSTTPLIRDAI